MTDQENLDRVLVRGVAWTAAVKWLAQIVTWGITLVVARLLAPSDYGLVGMATICLNFITLFSEFGLGTAIITFRDLSNEQVSQLNSLSLMLGVFGFGLAVAFAYPFAVFFKAPKASLVIVLMGVGFVVSGLRTVPYSLLQKDLRFKLLALIEGLQGIFQAIVTFVLAFLGFGYWALVLGILSVSFTSTVLTLIWRRQSFARPRFLVIRPVLIYSWHIVIGRLSWYFYNDSDFIVAGRVLGQAPLGAYTLAWTLAHAPLEKLSNLINRVTPSVFASIQSDFPALRRYLRNITGGLALIIFPATLGMALVAPEFVQLILGPKWIGVTVPLRLLALYALFYSNVILLTPVLNVIGEQRFAMWNHLATLVILPVSFYIGSRWGTGGIAGVWVLVYPFVSLPLYSRVFKRIQMTRREYLAALWPAVSGCLVIVLVVEVLKRVLSSAWPLYLRFTSEILAGAVAYALTLMLMHRNRLRAFFRLLNSFRSQVSS